MRHAAIVALLTVACAAASAGAATKLGGLVQDAGGTRLASGGRVLNGSVSQLAVGASAAGARVLRHGFWNAFTIAVLAVDDDPAHPAALPTRLEFGAPAPNPTRGAARFALALPAAARVSLRVFDVSGRELAALEPREMAAGRWTLEWPARAADGRTLEPGVYFARALVDGRVFTTRRVVVVR